ncbi:MAG TPA: hypothetical protein VD902_07000, partial [Symbiobacteriaceae bacterium]|nr:hypothetical protein [Symbiobacteriaceae bacterium]
GLRAKVTPGMRVAITAGSRGITGVVQLLATVAGYLRELGAEPVVVAAMGSHGGGTPEGQMAVLESLGITEAAVGAAISTAVDATVIGQTAGGLTVYADAFAARCDGILAINRVKPHTSFHGPLESGLAKMLVVGLGKAPGARQFHSLGAERLSGALADIGRVLLDRLPVLGGVAVLENGREETADLVPVTPGEILDREPELLERARALLPRLPVDALDLLVVEEMGKNFSGTGMDTNVIGRMGIVGVPDGEPVIARIAVLDLSEASHGNANGMGLADFITRRFQEKIDFAATYLNTLTATFVQRAKMPIALESDRAVLEAALGTLGGPSPDLVRAVQIPNTLMLERFLCSPAVLRELEGHPGVEVLGEAGPWEFDAAGRLITRVD